MYAKGVPEGYRPYDVFYVTENRYKSSRLLTVPCEVLRTKFDSLSFDTGSSLIK